MTKARFILNEKKVIEQYDRLRKLGVSVSYSYKTNRVVGDILQEEVNKCKFSIHNFDEIEMIKDKKKIWFFPQANSDEELKSLIERGVKTFVMDNEKDLLLILEVIRNLKKKINLILRMKFQEHRIGSGRYFVYGLPSRRINEIILELKDNEFIDKMGVHIHRKSQNTSEWNIVQELEDSITLDTLKIIKIVSLGGGLPIEYKTYSSNIWKYISDRIKESFVFLEKNGIETYIEPGRFIAGPPVELETEIIQVYDKIIVLNCSVYNCALDSMITNIKLLVKDELGDDEPNGDYFLIKGNTPTRDDIFRYKVKLRNPKVGDKIIFLNAGAYNYFCDFCSLERIKTEVL